MDSHLQQGTLLGLDNEMHLQRGNLLQLHAITEQWKAVQQVSMLTEASSRCLRAAWLPLALPANSAGLIGVSCSRIRTVNWA